MHGETVKHIHTRIYFFLTITDPVTSQNIDLPSCITLYK